MKTTIRQYTLSARLLQEGVKDPFGAYKSEGRSIYATLHNKFAVSVKNEHTGDRLEFIHYGLSEEFKAGIKELDRDALLRAFIVAMDNAFLGSLDYEGYCDLLGCDASLKENRKQHRKCRVMLDKFENDLLMDIKQRELFVDLICEPVDA